MREFDRLEGLSENQFLETKREPIRLETDKEKAEYAKDVTAFVNSRIGHGYIFIGFQRNHSLSEGDFIGAPRPFDRAHFKKEKLESTLGNWVYPILVGVKVDFFQHGSDPNKGIGVITIPPQNLQKHPFLTTRSNLANSKNETLLGIAERSIDKTQHRTVQDLHQAIRDGLSFQQSMTNRLDTLERLILQQSNSKEEIKTTQSRTEQLLRRRKSILDEFKK